jgi:hypothetical protein
MSPPRQVADPGKYGSSNWGTSQVHRHKSIEKKEQHAELCKSLATERYDPLLFPVVLRNAGTPSKSLDRATKGMDIPDARKRKVTASFTYTAYEIFKPCVPTTTFGKATLEARGRIRGK